MEPLLATCTAGYSAEVTEVAVPPLTKTGNGTGWGSDFAVRPAPVQLFWTRVYGLSPVPWSRYDVESGELLTIKGRAGVHGDLRDSVIDADARHGWFLLTGGFAHVDLENVRILRVLRTGFPTYLSRLFVLRDGLFAATGWTGGTVTIVDGHEMRVVKTVRMPSPDAVIRDDGTASVEMLSFNGMIARRFDLESLTLGRRRPLPFGAWPCVSGDRAWIVEGPRVVTPEAPTIRHIDGQNVAEVDIENGRVLRKSGRLADLSRVVGVDADGNVVVQQGQGMTVLDSVTLAPVVEVANSWGQFGAVAMLPDLRSAAVKPNWLDPERLAIVRWSKAAR